jgi:hypothetical protein
MGIMSYATDDNVDGDDSGTSKHNYSIGTMSSTSYSYRSSSHLADACYGGGEGDGGMGMDLELAELERDLDLDFDSAPRQPQSAQMQSNSTNANNGTPAAVSSSPCSTGGVLGISGRVGFKLAEPKLGEVGKLEDL